ncbi:MAG TPA: prepilin peptidase [Devosiaceae bacterium]|jgi:prepilin peptidase CpaA|nr:prepilin peptidase [Devosiaceae bacterium]
MLGKFVLLLFPLLMAFAASSDLLTMRISNRVVLLLVAAFCAVAMGIGMPLAEFGLHAACAALVLVVAFAFFSLGWIGGGDAKLAAATAFWLGFGLTLPYLLDAAIIGGAMTLLILMVRRWPLPAMLARISWIDRLHDAKTGIPYGIALAIAGLLTYSETAVFQRLVG